MSKIIKSDQFNFKYNNDAHIGQFWSNGDLAFLKIPKNSSTTILNEFGLSRSHLEYTDVIGMKRFAIVRDPIKRFISAFLEVLEPSVEYPMGRYRHVSIPQELISEMADLFSMEITDRFFHYLEFLKKNGFVELHCTPQVQYFWTKSGEKIDDIEIFNNEQIGDVNSDLYKFLGKTTHMGNHNISNNPAMKKYLIELSNNKDIKDSILSLYKEDNELYETIKNNHKK